MCQYLRFIMKTLSARGSIFLGGVDIVICNKKHTPGFHSLLALSAWTSQNFLSEKNNKYERSIFCYS